MAYRIPELPYDKTYHLFVCYEKKSLNFVRTIVDKLEAEEVKCCYGERDFRIGRSIIGNMYESIRKSLYMLIVLSEEFQDSPYCLHETEEAFNMKLKGEYDVIPIRIEPCTIPECLRHLVYIDVDDKDTIHNKVIDAMSNKDLRTDFREDRNGEDIQIKLEMYRNWLSFERYRLVFTEKERAKIWGNKFEVPADLLQDIEDTVNGSSLVKYGYICTWPGSIEFVSVIFFCLVILLTIVFLILFIKASGTDEEYIFLVIAIPSFFLAYLSVFRICKLQQDNGRGLCAVYLKTFRVLLDELWNISKENKKRTGMVFFFAQNTEKISPANLKFHIMRYNFKPCEDYFTRRLDERKFLKKFCRENESDQEYTSRMFDIYMRKNCDKLSLASTTHRHPMKNSAKCVCLLVEEWLKNM